MGSAYAVWTGIGAVGIAIVGMVWMSEPVTTMRVLCIGLIVIGPQRLPKVARTIGLYVGKLRRFVTDVRTDVERELKAEDLKSTFTDATGLSDFDDVKNIVEETSEEMRKVRESYDAARDELVTAGDDLSADGDEGPAEPAIGKESSGLQTNNQTQDSSDTAGEEDEDWDDEYEDVEDEFEARFRARARRFVQGEAIAEGDARLRVGRGGQHRIGERVNGLRAGDVRDAVIRDIRQMFALMGPKARIAEQARNHHEVLTLWSGGHASPPSKTSVPGSRGPSLRARQSPR